MAVSTRRGFLTMAGVGAAAVGAGSIAPAAQAKPVRAPADAQGPLVVYVTDMQRGELTLMHGEREVVIHDRDLAARLAHATQSR